MKNLTNAGQAGVPVRGRGLARAMGMTLAVLAPLPAAAQTIDHGSMEMLFGEPVTTSATGKPQRASEAPVPMDIITAEDIERTGAKNIPDAIQYSLGVDVVRLTPQAADVAVRGFNSPLNPRLLVLVNGRQVYFDHFGMTFWDAIPVQMGEIRQIEIVRGPNTALFGFNAATGVVNIVTYDPQYDDVNDVRVTYGTQDTKQISAVSTLDLGDVGGITFSGSAFGADAFDPQGVPGEPDVLPNIDPETYKLSARGQFQVGNNTVLGSEVTWSSTDRATLVPFFLGGNPDVETYSLKGTLTHEGSLGLTKANIYYNNLDHEVFINGIGQLFFENDVLVAQLENLFKVGAEHSFRLFGEVRDNSFEADFAFNPFGDTMRSGFNSFALSAMWNWRMSDSLDLTASVRYDNADMERDGLLVPGLPFTNDDFDKTIEEVTYNAGLVWTATPQDKVTLSAARGAKLPSLIEFGGNAVRPGPQPGSNVLVIGNPSLDAIGIESFNLGYVHNFAGTDIQLELDAFYTSLSGNITIGNFAPAFVVPPNVVLQPFDVGESEQVGVEARLNGTTGKVRWEVNYAYLDVDDDFDTVVNGAIRRAADFENSTPEHRINALIGSDITDRLSVDLQAQWVDSRQFLSIIPAPTGNTFEFMDVDDVLTLNGRIAYEVRDGVELSVTGFALNKGGNFRTSQADPIESRVLASIRLHW
ncbi:TonB-dependent receptor plug domain-containing protein [Yunchengibacter salinarum]|uniref:TonB-dependent receptor plug domain-containing protein n=1 Tax=Yunchengibacter salinarum TaxID=3133399 RepID=UPI0035B5C411